MQAGIRKSMIYKASRLHSFIAIALVFANFNQNKKRIFAMSQFFATLIFFVPLYVFPFTLTAPADTNMTTMHAVVPFLISMAFFLLRPVREFPGDVKCTIIFWVGPGIYAGLFYLLN